MENRWLSFFFSLVFIGAAVLCGILLYDNRQKRDEIHSLEQELKAAQQDGKHWLGEYQKLKSAIDQTASASQTQVSLLQQQIQSEQRNLDPLKQKIEQLKKAGDPLSLADINSHLQADQATLHALQDNLKQNQLQLKSVDSQTKNDLQNTKNELKYQNGIVNDQMKTLNASIKYAGEQVKYWQKQKLSPERVTKVQEFQAQQQTLQNQLNDLKRHKADVDHEGQQHELDVNSGSGSEKSALQSAQQNIQSQITQTQQDLKHWQDMQSVMKRNDSDRSQQLHKIQDEYSAQQKAIADHEREMKDKNQTLNQLKTNEK